jgi:ATP-dependent DNA helicase RecG
LHHFLGEEDLKWLGAFDRFDLDDNQKKALIFLRETGAVDNSVYRQFSGVDTLHASSALRKLREYGLLIQKGKGTATYYVAGGNFPVASETLQDAMPDYGETLQGSNKTLIGGGETLIGDPALDNEIKALKKRVGRKYLEDMIVRMCRARPFRAEDLSRLLKRNETYLHEILTALVKSKRLMYTIPEMPTHPNQMYRASD